MAGLVWTSSLLHRATHGVIRDTTSRNLAAVLELRLLSHQRLNELEPSAEIRMRAQSDFVADARELLVRIRANAETPEQKELVERVSEDMVAYWHAQDRREALADGTDWEDSDAALERALESLDALRLLNAERVILAEREAERVARLATIAAGAAAILLLAGLALVVFGARRFVVRPLLDLQDAIRRFRRTGDPTARATPAGSRELREVTLGFNAMIDELGEQREARLAYTAGVVHDLRNPLSALHTAVAVVKSSPDDRTRERMLDLIERQVGRLKRMLDDLLDAARIDAGHLELHRERIDLRETAREMCEFYEPSAPHHHIVLEVPPKPVIAWADPVRMEQVFGNLISNAVKYSPNGGRIDVKVSASDGEGVVEVRDEGLGIPKERFDDLFTPFRRIETGGAPGAGLGLSTVKRIVEAHGGHIEVESILRQGSTFRVRLPLALQERALSPARRSTRPGDRPGSAA